MPLTLLPAVDVADGQAVRLVQGAAAGSETAYGDPLEAALAWQADGAEWIHLVDLDAAFGRGSNAHLLAEVVGGSTSRWSCPAASATTSRCRPRWPPGRPGSTSAPPPGGPGVVRPGLRRVRRPGGDRAGRARPTLSARGWTRDGGDLFEVLARLDKAGAAARYVVTDITKDGMLRAPTWTCCARSCPAPTPGHRLRRVSQPRRPAALRTLAVRGPGGVEGHAMFDGRSTSGASRLRGRVVWRLRRPRGHRWRSRVIPCSWTCDAGRGGQGGQLPRPARRRRPGGAGGAVRRGRRGRADLPRRDRLLRRPGTMLDVVRRTAESVFIPLTVGGGVRRVADVDACCGPARTRWG